jgi:hypothetical protein
MSTSEQKASQHESKQPRRTAGVVLGGLAAGAVLGAGIAAQPAQAAAEEPSIKEQFGSALTPGAYRADLAEHAMIVVGGPDAPMRKHK